MIKFCLWDVFHANCYSFFMYTLQKIQQFLGTVYENTRNYSFFNKTQPLLRKKCKERCKILIKMTKQSWKQRSNLLIFGRKTAILKMLLRQDLAWIHPFFFAFPTCSWPGPQNLKIWAKSIWFCYHARATLNHVSEIASIMYFMLQCHYVCLHHFVS